MRRDFRELAEEYAGVVFTYARYSLRHREDAEDITQEVLVRLWKHRDAIEPGRTRAWVMQVARNLVIDVARRQRARTAVFASAPPSDESVLQVAAPGTPESEAERSEMRGVLEDAIAALDEPYRSIVVMREIQGLAYDEIATALHMPLGTIKVYLHRGRRRLREAVGRELDR
jgi:RNA polymerase sigma-70 factor (ECF subfamily)